MYPVLCCESFSLHGPRLQTELWVSRKVCVQLCICKQQRRKHLSALSVLPKDHHLIVFVCTANRVSVTIKETRPQIPRWVKRSSVASKSTLNTLKLHLTRCSSTCSPLSLQSFRGWLWFDSVSVMSADSLAWSVRVMMFAICQGLLSNHTQCDTNWALCVIKLQDIAPHCE